MKFTYQKEMADCGSASLYMIASTFGCKISYENFKRAVGSSIHGVTFTDICEQAELLSLVARHGTADCISNVKENSILHWNGNHFVSLKRVTNKYVFINDPAKGELKMTYKEANSHFTNHYLNITVTENTEKSVTELNNANFEKPTSVFSLFMENKGILSSALMISLVFIFSHLLLLMTPEIFKITIQESQSTDTEVLMYGFLFISVFTVLGLFLNLFSGKSLITYSTSAKHLMEKSFYRKLFTRDFNYYSKTSLGGVLSSQRGFESVQELLSTDLIKLTSEIVLIIIALSLMVRESAIITITLIMLILILIGIQKIISDKECNYFRAMNNEQATRDSYLLGFCQNIFSVISSGREHYAYNAIEEKNNKYIATSAQLSSIKYIGNIVSEAGVVILDMIIIAFSCVLLIAGEVTYASLIALFAYKSFVFSHISAILNVVNDLFIMKSHNELSKDVLNAKKVEGLSPNNNLPTKPSDYLHINEVKTLNNGIINEKIQKGSLVIIKGETGSGKTTIVRQILGISKLKSGDITYGSISIKEDMFKWRGLISSISQEDKLFNGTVEENIAFFSENVDQKRMKQSCLDADVLSDIQDKSKGFLHYIDGNNPSFSGGQQQRILIARALYNNSPILLMDEPTSNLDQESELIILQNLKRSGKIVIMIAHRENCLKLADRIISLD